MSIIHHEPDWLSSGSLLQRAAALLAAADDHSWDELLPIVEYLEHHAPRDWEDLAVATLEVMVARNACEALGRDPWSSVAPLMTALLRGLACHVPRDPLRAMQAVNTLFVQLRSADSITWPDGLPGAVAKWAASCTGFRTQLVDSFAQAVDHSRLSELLAYKRTNRRELKSLRRITADPALVNLIDTTLMAGISNSHLCERSHLLTAGPTPQR
ncbi:hypothetical protein [Roseateles sp.]|uniref:hypothetical protein n=1 Tax=Roseateles sp. TaxID=1971397 RepID=UPI00326400C4